MNRRGNRPQSDWSTTELLDDRQQQFAVHLIEPVRVDFHAIQRIVCDLFIDPPVVIDFSIITYTTQQPIDDAWCAARASRDLTRAFIIDLDAEDLSRALADHF